MEQPLTQRTGAPLEPTTLQPRAPRPQTAWSVPQGSTVQALLTLPTPVTVALGGTVRAVQTAQTPPPTEGNAPLDITVLKAPRPPPLAPEVNIASSLVWTLPLTTAQLDTTALPWQRPQPPQMAALVTCVPRDSTAWQGQLTPPPALQGPTALPKETQWPLTAYHVTLENTVLNTT